MSQAGVQLAAGTTIPVVDFAAFMAGDAAARTQAARGIREAFEEYGFVYLRNPGVPQALLDALFARMRAFFALPAEAKARAGGYVAPGARGLDTTRPADVKESFSVRATGDPPDDHWPVEPSDFRDTLLTFRAEAWQACARVMQALAVAFTLPEDYFAAPHRAPAGSISLLHYPPLGGPLQPGQLRSGAHTDWGTITLLFHDGNAGGLEIQRPDGTWLPAPSLPGAAIVNVADLLTRWSNDVLRSVPHRVVLPEDEAATRSRYSVAAFYQPSHDTLITCLEPCQGPDRPARYPPITAGEHVQAKRQAITRDGSRR